MFKKIITFFFILLILAGILLGVAFFLLPLPGHPTVLMYHFIETDDAAARSTNYVSERSFRNQMRFLKTFGYRVLAMDEYRDILLGRKPSRGREVVITFDDGNYSFLERAAPSLRKYQFPATQFMVTDYIRDQIGGSMDVETLKNLLKEKWFSIGSHSKSHRILTEISPDDRWRELAESKRDLEAIFGKTIFFFAYPAGRLNYEVMEEARRAGYDLAFSTAPKQLTQVQEGRYSMTRTKISREDDNLFVFWIKVSGIYQFHKRWRSSLKKNAAPSPLDGGWGEPEKGPSN